MPQLITPTTRLHVSWLAARAEWNAGDHQAGGGVWLAAEQELADPDVFAAWVGRLCAMSDRSRTLPAGQVHDTHWWIVEGDTYLGAIDLRHELNDLLLHAGGHIGYSVRPSARRRGLATWALGAVLAEARSLGLDRALLTCDDTNTASARTIERNGGVLEDVRETELGRKRRYWIEL
ncbi:GNAT family N-acetyltransferase [Streptomyces sp. SKN60]|uniref:GNAT family N-acetyltransferase n=1 Tax=Streptomyces sp. SKN60 TaxID=2855506 RepID=UPI002245A0F7|nr:GNAT family N-acetyltransferase [Streptomyces sp. SKN60]MCX2181209.1 GNAT family N-acetyltransferase [Streptomyces sp. SKN60]